MNVIFPLLHYGQKFPLLLPHPLDFECDFKDCVIEKSSPHSIGEYHGCVMMTQLLSHRAHFPSQLGLFTFFE